MGFRILPALVVGSVVALFASAALETEPRPAFADVVQPVPDEVRTRFGLSPLYTKAVVVDGFPVVAAQSVEDFALVEAAYLIRRMTARRPEILRALAEAKVRFCVMAYDQRTTDVPEHSDLTPPEYWDRRARGLGATKARPAVSCGEENLLGFPGDPYATENILIHELAHALHEMGLDRVDASFDERLRAAYEEALAQGLWKDAYAAVNKEEYWAEGAQSWFDTNRENDDQHNHVDTREELVAYDPRLAALCAEVFGDGSWRYRHPREREEPGHLAGYDASRAPPFEWSAEELAQPLQLPDEQR